MRVVCVIEHLKRSETSRVISINFCRFFIITMYIPIKATALEKIFEQVWVCY